MNFQGFPCLSTPLSPLRGMGSQVCIGRSGFTRILGMQTHVFMLAHVAFYTLSRPRSPVLYTSFLTLNCRDQKATSLNRFPPTHLNLILSTVSPLRFCFLFTYFIASVLQFHQETKKYTLLVVAACIWQYRGRDALIRQFSFLKIL